MAYHLTRHSNIRRAAPPSTSENVKWGGRTSGANVIIKLPLARGAHPILGSSEKEKEKEKEKFMSPLARKIVIAAPVLGLVYVSAGYVLGRSSDDKAFRALTAYSEVLQHVQRDYVDDPNLHQVTAGALHGLLDSLDPQSGYMSPLEYKDFKEKSSNQAKAAAGVTLT